MKQMGTRALVMAGVIVTFLLVGGSAQARGFDLRQIDWDQVRARIQQFKENQHVHSLRCEHKNEKPRPGSSVPEPSAALVFGLGLLVARSVARRNR